MGWKLSNKPRTLKVTRCFAKEFAELDSAPHDRPLSERRLTVYRRLFAEGQFRPCTWAKAFCQETNGWYRVNGKHTSTFLSSVEEMPEFYVTLEEYHCDTLNDVARLYATFDSRMQSRTSRDINVSFAGTVPELAGITGRIINACVSGMSFREWGNNATNKQAAERAELLLEHPDFVVWCNSIIGVSGKSSEQEGRKSAAHLTRGAVIAAMMSTWMKASAQATVFWTAVRDESGERNTLPDRKLGHWLLTTQTMGPTNRAKNKADTREFYSRCITGWNAWRKNERTELRYYPEKDLPTAV